MPGARVDPRAIPAVIVSASVNADVPARYGAWFMRRVDQGFCRIHGAEGLKSRRIELTPGEVDAFVFWTRNARPFFGALHTLQQRGYAFCVQLATASRGDGIVPERFGEQLRRLADAFGPRVVVCRIDPLELSHAHEADDHLRYVDRLAKIMGGSSDELVIAFARGDRDSVDPVLLREKKRALMRRCAQCLHASGVRLRVCADIDALAPGVSPARCIDADRLSDLAHRPITSESAGFLADCLCARSVDIGNYGAAGADAFCGANKAARGARHDQDSEFLFLPKRRFATCRGADLPF